MRESLKIILQCIKIAKGPVKSIDGKISPPNRDDLKQSMEALIHQNNYSLKDIGSPWEMFTQRLKLQKVNLESI